MSNDDIKRAARAMAESDGFCWENCAQSYWIDHARIAKAALVARQDGASPRRMDREELARVISKKLYGDFDVMTSWTQQDARAAADAVIEHLSAVEQQS